MITFQLPRSILIGAAFLASSLANASAIERVVLHPDWFPGPQLAGIYVAIERGFYRDAGLEVEIRSFDYGVESGLEMADSPETCALGTIESYVLLQRRARGQDLVALAAILQDSPAGFMSLRESGVTNLRRFADKKVGIYNFGEPLVAFFLREAGLDATRVAVTRVDRDIGRLTRKEVQIMQGDATDEYIRLQLSTGGEGRFLRFSELGLCGYSQVCYAPRSIVERHGETLRKFLAATRVGWEYALDHTEETAELIARRYSPNTDTRFLAAALCATANYVSPQGRSPLAPMTLAKWRRVAEQTAEMGFASSAEAPEAFVDSRFNP